MQETQILSTHPAPLPGPAPRGRAVGRALVFDACQVGVVLRAVLFVDFERPCRAPVRWLNRLVLAAAPFTDEIRRGKANHDAWERNYYRDKKGPD